MSGLKPLMRETREAVLKGAARAKDRLHQVADNMNDHVDDVARRVRAQDKFDDKPDMTPPAGRVLQDLPKDMDVDHIHELQLGGKDSVHNSWLLDSSVNRSTGSQIRQLIGGTESKPPTVV